MKISDEISLSARNLLRRKGRTALTLVGVVIGTCMVVLMISLGIAQTKTNEEMLQSWGDLTQVQIYGYGTMVGSDGKPLYLDDAAIASIKQIPHVAAATPYAQAYNLEGTITAGRNDRYTMEIYNLIGIDPTALEPMGFALQSGSWPTNTPHASPAITVKPACTRCRPRTPAHDPQRHAHRPDPHPPGPDQQGPAPHRPA